MRQRFKAALKKREEAVQTYREALRKSMLESDPAIGQILEKMRSNRAKSAVPRGS